MTLIAFEGIDGTGKSTQAKLLATWLEQHKIPYLLTQEPTTDFYGKLLRKRLKDANSDPLGDACLFALDRSHHYYDIILPAMMEQKIVLTDRYIDSSIAYQSIQCANFFPNQKLAIEWIRQLNQVPEANLIFLFDTDPNISVKRRTQETAIQDLEKFEHTEFLMKVRQVFLNQATSDKYIILNATLSIEELQTQIQNHIVKHIPHTNFK